MQGDSAWRARAGHQAVEGRLCRRLVGLAHAILLVTGVAVLIGYALLGVTWLNLKTVATAAPFGTVLPSL
jgi:hypothetical protein